MRTEAEMRALLTRLTAEYDQLSEDMTPDPIRVKHVQDFTYQITIRQGAESLALAITLLRWALGEIDLNFPTVK